MRPMRGFLCLCASLIAACALGACASGPGDDARDGGPPDAGSLVDALADAPETTVDAMVDVAADAPEDTVTDAEHDAPVDAAQDSGAAPAVRGMWTSEYGHTVASAPTGSATRSAFFQQLAAKQMNRVILEARAMLKSDKAGLRTFVEDCHSRGIDVEAMINARLTGYTLRASADDLATYAAAAAGYQQAYCPSGSEPACLSAFNVDYEPHIFPEWSSDRAAATTDYLTGLANVHAALAGSVPLAAAVTNWYDGAAYEIGGKTFVEAILDAGVQRLYLMNYTDSPSQMVSRATGEMDIACAYAGGEREVLSLSDAKDEGASPADQALTFHEEGWGAMNAAWATMTAQFTGRRCFHGNAGFDYDDMIALGP